ncbi:hypothetical protein LX36DRAFT_474524 [Colletotrichum falcatum]|nr:hypothetical protein LX36DRAFT_474524 [Colletotrichum falcatum]
MSFYHAKTKHKIVCIFQCKFGQTWLAADLWPTDRTIDSLPTSRSSRYDADPINLLTFQEVINLSRLQLLQVSKIIGTDVYVKCHSFFTRLMHFIFTGRFFSNIVWSELSSPPAQMLLSRYMGIQCCSRGGKVQYYRAAAFSHGHPAKVYLPWRVFLLPSTIGHAHHPLSAATSP